MSLLAPAKARTRVTPQPSAGVWPGLHDVSKSPIHAAIAKRLTKAAVKKLPITLQFPDGTRWGAGGPVLQIVDPTSFFRRLGTEGLIGFGEAWMTGEITTGGFDTARPAASYTAAEVNAATDELAAVLTVMAKRMSVLIPGSLQKLRKAWQSRTPREEENTLTGSKENIHRHYDLSNDLFEQFLDETMMYSSAWYEFGENPEGRPHQGPDPQDRRHPGPRAGETPTRTSWRSVPAGAPWPSARRPERGVRVTTLTLSEEQKALADARIEAAGLSHLIEVRPRGLPRSRRDPRRPVRRRRQRRDDRSGRREVLARLLRLDRPHAGPRRTTRPPGHHDGSRPTAGDPQRLHLGPQVRVPRWDPAVPEGHR